MVARNKMTLEEYKRENDGLLPGKLEVRVNSGVLRNDRNAAISPSLITSQAEARALVDHHLSLTTRQRLGRELQEPGYAELIAAAWRMVMP